MKLCKDCKHCRVGFIDKFIIGYGAARCAVVGEEISKVDGKGKFAYCSVARLSACGAAAQYFDPIDRAEAGRE